jgi:(p)ppGpp synthase/HD superfamily hydrolase
MKNIETIKAEKHKLAKAVKFLVDKVLDKSGEQKQNIKTDKPLVMHSLEIAFYLKNLGYDNKIVIAAVLHDLLEDTDTKKGDIEDNFGKKIANIVKAVSYDFNVKKDANYKDNYDKMINFKEALIVKAADIKENAGYFKFAPKKEHKQLLKKWNYFLGVADLISNEPVYRDLKNKLIKIK